MTIDEMPEDEDDDPCPECGAQLQGLSSGVECPAEGCDYWFCF